MDETLSHLQQELRRVDELCVPSEDKSKDLTLLLKQLYDASSGASSRPLGPLQHLHVDGVDTDTIWEELQSKNRPLKRLIKNKSKKLMTKLIYEAESEDESEGEAVEEEDSSEEEGSQEESEGEVADSEEDEELEQDSVGSESEGEPADDAAEGEQDDDSEHEQMEHWLDEFEDMEDKHKQKLERGTRRGGGHKGAVEDEEEDDFDFVSSTLYDLEDDEAEDATDIMAGDFFGSIKSKGKKGRKNVAKVPARKAPARAAEEDEDDYYNDEGEGINMDADSNEEDDNEDWDENGDDDYAESEEEAEPAVLSKHQQRQANIAQAVSQLEEEAIGPKSWDMKGEVRALDRPENSLLGVTVDVERASKPTPIVTQEYTNSLEDMIMQRVKLGKFDDVIPREIREKHGNYDKEEFNLSQEKSKQGLGDIYAEDFVQKSMDGSAGTRDQESRDREEVSGLFAKVCRQLDALSHFHYAPKPVVAEPTITSSAPSISMEDIGPTTEHLMAASMQAPEEVLSHKRGRDAAFLSAEELSRDDKKRLRRAAKTVRRKRIHEDEVEEKLAAKVNPMLGRKYEAKKADKRMKSDRRVVEGSSMQLESDDKVKSFSKSANFFSALQKQSEEDIRKKKEGKKGSSANKGNEGSSEKSGTRSAALKL